MFIRAARSRPTSACPRSVRSRYLLGAAASCGLLAALSTAGFAQTVASPTTTWTAVKYNGAIPTEPIQDQQTGQPTGDIVGNSSHPFLYTLFDPGTPSGASNTDGTLYFRIRLNEGGTTFKSAAFVGLSFTSLAGNPVINLFAGVNNSGSADQVAIYRSDPNKANTSPSTSGIGSVITSYTETASNYYYSPVTAVNDPSAGSPVFNFDSSSTGDYFIGFAIPFADLVSAASGAGAGSITDTTSFRLIAFTATQANTLNQDIGGLNDKTANLSDTYTNLGIISDPGTAAGFAPTPAPPGAVSGLIGIMMAGGHFGILRLRRAKKAKQATAEDGAEGTGVPAES